MGFEHISVMLEECIDGLAIKPDGIYVDGTLGGAGHSFHIAAALNDKGLLIGIDQDEEAIAAAEARLAPYKDRVRIVRSNYADIKNVLAGLGIEKVDGILLDLGVSSHQLDTADRGFSYMKDAPLDMRMDQRHPKTAADILNTYSEKELARIIRNYGEEKYAGKIARFIVKTRDTTPIKTTMDLVAIIDRAIPAKERRAMQGHPAKRTFQGIRIELNAELDVLRDTLDDMIDILNPGGRLCIITFHSLEDRIVKQSYRTNEDPCICPKDFPVCICGRVSKGKAVPRKAILPSVAEMDMNPRSKSAKLRVFVKGDGEVDEKQRSL